SATSWLASEACAPPHHLEECFARFLQARPHCTKGQTGELGDLRAFETFELEQHEHLALPEGELLDHRAHGLEILGARVLALGRLARMRRHLDDRTVIALLESEKTEHAAPMTHAQVDRDAVQPGPHFSATVERGPLLVGDDE